MLPRASSSLSPTGPTILDPSSAVRLTSSSSIAVTVTVFLLFLCFFGLLSIFARRYFATSRGAGNIVVRALPDDGQLRRYLGRTGGPAGLDLATVRALPVLTYTGGAKEVVGCVVCLGEFEKKQRVKLIPGCGHVFHPDCIDGWLVLHGSCPICRCSRVLDPGTTNISRVWVHLNTARADEESAGDDSENREERNLAGLGRSKSFNRSREDTVFLRRTCSV